MSAYNDRQNRGNRYAKVRTGVNLDGVARFLRNIYPTNTAANVAADTRIKARTVERWLAGAGGIGGAHYTALWLAYGPEFLVAATFETPAWLDRAAKDAELAALDLEIEAAMKRRDEAKRRRERACDEHA